MTRKNLILTEALNQDIINNNMLAVGVLDYSQLQNTVNTLHEAFSDNFIHTFAVKANALIDVMKNLRKFGMGAEVASSGELQVALAAGYQAKEIILDSPAKTMEDLRTCIENDISVNIDNLQELERVDGLIKEFPGTKSVIGFRVNAQIGTGKIDAMSTATSTSKFGFGIADDNNHDDLIDIYLQRPWLTSIHTHSGSQGVDLALMVKGVEVIVNLAQKINEKAGKQQITRLDIGGGLPVNFASEEVTPTFAEYAAELKKQVPVLFTDTFQVKTEFGRAVIAKNGFIITRVEYTKSMGGRYIAITHAGAQVLTRTAFVPKSWPLRVSIYNQKGELKTEENTETITSDIAGPCCFAGDLICKEQLLPKAEQNDYVMIHDTGGYYFSNHFDYNSLPRLAVYSVSGEDDALQFNLIRKADTLEDVLSRM